MKALQLSFLALVLVGFVACAQDAKNVPTEVQSAFESKFPAAKNVKWEKENETEWEAEFKKGGKEYSANFLTDGSWVETEYQLKKSEIPSLVQKTLDEEFAGYEVEEAEVSETNNGKVYEFELEGEESELEVTIDTNGKVINKVSEELEDGED